MSNSPTALYGVMAEFGTPGELESAVRRATEAGYTRMEAYSPIPIEGIAETMGFKTRLPLLVLIGGILGATGGFLLEYWVSVIEYPLNVGGRPFFSWPAFVPVVFECTVLAAGLTAVIGMIALNKLPEPYHPVFNAPRFSAASDDRFFLAIEAEDPHFTLEGARKFLQGLGAAEVVEVPR